LVRKLLVFGNYAIDLHARALFADGEQLSIEPKVFDCLAYLIENRDRAVGRDELMAAVWGKADVSDAMLGQGILKARRAVRDTGGNQKIIRTVTRFGYQWVATVEATSHSERVDATTRIPKLRTAAHHDEASTRARRNSHLLLSALGFIAAALAMMWGVLKSL
jgi:DNA-binding winged helix-turn-helix (wHTH) protein